MYQNVAFGLLMLSAFTSAYTPIVLWHGMGDTCCNPRSLGSKIEVIKSNLPGVYVRSLKIGDTTDEEVENGYFKNINSQVEAACKQIAGDPQLRDGYNAIGFSQGAQFLRAVAQRCPSPRMINLISIGGQHQGIYGLPKCAYGKLCNYLRILLSIGAYWGWVQEKFVQAGYWHDPLHEDKYRSSKSFIADINNERNLNTAYRDNLKKLQKFVLVKFEKDTMVEPVETEWFGFYRPGQGVEITNLFDSSLYNEDRLGLKTLYDSGRLDFISIPRDHLQFTNEWFVDEIIRKYLS